MSRYGIREICDVTFKALTSVDIGNQHFDAGQPVLILDTAKTSSLEGAATTVYAQGGKGNPRLIGWDGEKTLTFTVEDALISAESFAMLSGAGVVKGGGAKKQKIYMHTAYDLLIEGVQVAGGEFLYARLNNEVRDNAKLVVAKEAPVYGITLDNAGAPQTFLSAITQDEIVAVDAGKPWGDASEDQAIFDNKGILKDIGSKDILFKIEDAPSGSPYAESTRKIAKGMTVRIDCYSVHEDGATELQIDAETFAGYYYIEADTLFREEATGRDLPAQFVIPRGKIQSNFTFTMANSGDPSTFTFTIDCFPAYTKFNKTKKVMATLQVLDSVEYKHNYSDHSIIGHDETRTSDDDVVNAYDYSIWNEDGDEEGGDDSPTG